MKSKKMLKFLVTTILVATVTTSNALVFATKEKIKTVEVEKVSKDATEKEVYTKEEIENKIKEEYENFSENKNIETKKNEELLEILKEIFKNFRIEDYEIKGFKLTVYFKNGVPILYYEHIKTGAKIIIIPINNLNPNYVNSNAITDDYIFKAFKPDDSGLVHYLEHCVASDMLKIAREKDVRFSCFNACTEKDNLFFAVQSNCSDDSVINSLIKNLRDPAMLKKENIFKIEKSRIINEMEYNELLFKTNEKNSIDDPLYGKFNSGGTPEELKKISSDEVIKYFKQIMHPSNLLVTKYLNLNPSNVKKYINFLYEKYLKYYDNKEIFVEPFRKKENFNYKKIETCKIDNVINSKNAMGEVKDYNFKAKITFIDPENEKEKLLHCKLGVLGNFQLLKSFKETLALEKFVKNLGYLDVSIISLNEIVLYGDDEKLFEKEKLIENHNKIFNYVIEKFKNFSDEEIERNVKELSPKPYNAAGEDFEELQELFASPIRIRKDKFLARIFKENYIDFNEPFSKNRLEITENNEIKDSKEYYINKIKKDIVNLKEFKNKTPSKILVFFRSESKKLDPKLLKDLENWLKEYLVPIKFEGIKNAALLHVVTEFLIYEITKEIHSRALNYYGPQISPILGTYIAFNNAPNGKIFNNELNFFYKDFRKYLENLKISEQKFKEFKENSKKMIQNNKNDLEYGRKEFKKALRAVNFYLEHGLDENADVYNETKGGFKINSKTTRGELYKRAGEWFSIWDPSILSFSSFEEYLNYKKLENEFILKYGHLKKLKQKYVLIDKEFVKDLKKYIIEPLEKAISNKEKFEKEIINKMDSVSYEDFVKTLKSCSLVEKETYEKDQKKLDEILRKTLGYGI